MKEPLRLPFVYLLVVLCVTAVLAGLQVCAGGGPLTLGGAVARLPRAAFEVVLPAVLLSIVLLGFRMVRRPFSRFVAFLIVLGVSYAVLVNGLIWTHRAESLVRAPAASPPVGRVLGPRTFTAVGGRLVAPIALEADRVEPVLVLDPDGKAPRFAWYRTAAVSIRDGTVTLGLAGARPVEVRGDLDPEVADLVRADSLTALFLRDFRAVNDDLRTLLERAPARFFLACFAAAFLATALLVLLRATRWPLANLLLLVLALRLALLAWRVLAVDLAPAVARIVADPLAARLAPPAVFLAIGVLALLADVLLVPADRWTAEGGR